MVARTLNQKIRKILSDSDSFVERLRTVTKKDSCGNI